MRTVCVRVREDTAASLKRVAAARGTTPGVVMATAWRWWVSEHRDEIVADLDTLREALRTPREVA